MVLRRRHLLTFCCLFLPAACDRAPTEPRLREIADVVAAADNTSSRTTLPALLSQVAARVELEEGDIGVQTAFAEWKKLQNQLKAEAVASDRAAIQAKLAAIHAEELRIVLRELGSSVVTSVISETNVGATEAATAITAAQANGADVGRALIITQQIRRTTSQATQALMAQEYTRALDLATQAASLLNSLNYFLVELRRIDGIETLYPRAIASITEAQGTAAADAIAAQVTALDAEARAALRASDRPGAQLKLNEVRAAQIRVVLAVLGPETARTLVTQVDTRIAKARVLLGELEQSGREVVKPQRMLREANDLNVRAATALAKGDHATALDLGSHAAGLLNALQHLTR